MFMSLRSAARPLLSWILAGSLVVALSGCLGTAVDSPSRGHRGPAYGDLRVSLLAAPRLIEANQCSQGLSDVTIYVPPWGLAVGILSFGIVVPQWTIYSCAE